MDLSLRGRVPVCMRCGSRDVRHQTRGEGLWPGGGEGVAWVCEACHHIGAPFLLDTQPDAGPMEAWTKEYAEAAFAVESDAWEPERQAGGRAAGIVFIALGTFVLLLFAAALQQAFLFGAALAVVGTALLGGWLLALGSALIVVGLRRLRPPQATPPDDLEGGPGTEAAGATGPAPE